VTEPYAPFDVLAEQPAPRRRPLVLIAITLAALIAGAAAGVGGLLLAGFRQPVERSYSISVFLEKDVTDAQKTIVQSQLEQFPHQGGVEHESSAQALARSKEMWKDRPDFLDKLNETSLPQSFKLASAGTTFNCAPLAVVRKLPGVSDVTIHVAPAGKQPGGEVLCY
jgi:cell division protein FtsX